MVFDSGSGRRLHDSQPGPVTCHCERSEAISILARGRVDQRRDVTMCQARSRQLEIVGRPVALEILRLAGMESYEARSTLGFER
jgi:hypothetical protein